MERLATGATKANRFSSSVASFLFYTTLLCSISLDFSPFILFFHSSLQHISFSPLCVSSQSFTTMLPLTPRSSFRILNWLAVSYYIVSICSLILKNYKLCFPSYLLPYYSRVSLLLSLLSIIYNIKTQSRTFVILFCNNINFKVKSVQK